MNPDVFIELSKILLITVVVTGLVRLVKQPAIIGYILSGIIAGPFVFDVVGSMETLTTFSHIGVALLLFLVGLNLNPKVIKDVGKVSLVTGVGQVLFTIAISFGITRLLGFSLLTSAYVAIALAFSSTIVIMKLISDKKETETLYGRIAIGFLIVQDFIAIFILLIISSYDAGVSLGTLAAETFIKGIGGILLLVLVGVYVLPSMMKVVAKSQEFLLLFSLSWCFIVATGFHYLNFSIEAGALLAGIALSMSPYHVEISSKMKPLRDFFLMLFFIVLGSQMLFTNIAQNIGIILLFSLLVLVGNPLIVMTLMGFLGYTKRNGFLAGLAVAQISEFSLVIISLGLTVGHIGSEVLSIITAVSIITFTISTYMILYAHRIYPAISSYLSFFERKGKKVDEHKYHKGHDHDIILFGYNRIGFDIVDSLKKIKKKFLIVDYDPDVVLHLSKEGYDCRYGDANDSELLDEMDYSQTKMVISTIPEIDTNLLIIHHVREKNADAIVSMVAHQIDDAIRLYDAGATYVIMPHFLGGKHFSTMIERNRLSTDKFLKEKIAHIEHLHERREQGHEHLLPEKR